MTNLNVDKWIVPESDSLYEFSGQNCIEERMFRNLINLASLPGLANAQWFLS